MAVGERIKASREKAGLSQTALADKIGVSKQTLYKYENNIVTNVPSDKIELISAYTGVTPGYLMGWDSSKKDKQNPKKPIRIPVLGRVAAGIPVEAITDVIDYEELDPDKFCEGEYFALQIHGDSMEPRMRDGDVVIVKRQSDIESGDIAIVRVNGYDATCKKVLKQNDGIMIVGLNPSFTPIFYSKEQIKSLPVEIDGKVVELRAKF